MTELDAQTQQENIDFPQPVKRRRKRRNRSRLRKIKKYLKKVNWMLVLLGIFMASVVVMVSVIVLATDAFNQIESSWISLSRVLDGLQNTSATDLTFNDFERLQLGVSELRQSLSNARRRVSFFRTFSPLNADLEAIFTLLDTSYQTSLATERTLNGLQPTLFFLAYGGEESEEDDGMLRVASGERIVELLSLGRGQFLSASELLESAQQNLMSLNLAALSTDMLMTYDDVERYTQQITEINELLLNAPNMLNTALGLLDTQSYLVLAQNSDELRPSGGYISTYGWMTIRNARITDYDYSATTATSPNPPPTSLASEVELPKWWFQFSNPIYAAWDGSWYADFAKTAEMSAWYYDQGQNPHSPVDGVISIDLVGFEYILEALGKVNVPQYDVIVTSENFRDQIYAIREEGEHKRFLAALYREILADWREVTQEDGPDMLRAVMRALQEKHIMLYTKNERLNRALELLGWGGLQESGTSHDYLMVADANSGSKSSRSVLRNLTYDVQIADDDTLESRLTISYDYSADIAEDDPAVKPAHYQDIDYHNLVQIFVPLDSTLVEASNFDPWVAQADTHTIFTQLTEVPYNSSERFQILYETPPIVEAFGPYKRYRLLIQKQPGTLLEVVNVQVALPDGASIIESSPAPVASYSLEQTILEYRFNIVSDRWIELIFRQ
jgi:hypothetical protein